MSYVDGITVVIAVFFFAFVAILGYYLLDQMLATPEMTGNQYLTQGRETFAGMDTLVAAAIVLFGVVIIAAGFLLKTSPVFFILVFFVSLFGVVFSATLSNVFFEIFSSGPLAAAANNFPLTSFVFQNLPLIMMGISGLSFIVTLGKPSNSPGGY